MRFLFIVSLIFATLCNAAPLKILSIKNSTNEVRIIFNDEIFEKNFTSHKHKNGVFYDIKAELTIPKKSISLENDSEITIAQNTKKVVRIVISSPKANDLIFKISNKTLILRFQDSDNLSDLFATLNVDSKQADSTKGNAKDVAKKPKDSTQKADSTSKDSPKDKDSTKNDDRQDSTIQTAKGKIIVLDAGHGGKDCGAKVGKVCEKTLTLAVSKKTAEILKKRGYKVFVTRNSDKYLSLTDRTKIANDKNADIFISIHANALDKKSKNYKNANGIETYFLSTARSERARKVAELENKDDIEVMNHFSKLSFLNSINSQRLLASNKLAIDVQSGMLINARKIYKKTLDGGVREGPFWVLAGALMPSVLIEVGYMTNDTDLKRLQIPDYQNALARGIADGIDGYFLKNF